MKFYILNYHGGGADTVCKDCLPEAKRESKENGSLVSTALVSDHGAHCQWCGLEGTTAA